MSSPIQPVQGDDQSADYIIVDTPVVPVTLKGTAAQIALVERLVRSVAFGKETVERYQIAAGQEPMARAFMNDCLAQQTCVNAERKSGRGENTDIEITWSYDREDETWTPGADPQFWDFEIVETSQPLASHPYFGRHDSLSESDLAVLMTEFGKIDASQYKTNTTYKAPSSASAAVKTILSRYGGLRFFGVDEHNPVAPVISIRYRLYQSQVEGGTNSITTWPYIFHGINRVINMDLLNPPEHILQAINSLESWVFDSAGNTFPAVEPAGFVWIRQKPLIRLSGQNPNGPSDVTEYLLGVQQASAVLHPPLDQTADPGWDPQLEVT